VQVFEFVLGILLIVFVFKLIELRMKQSHERKQLPEADEADLRASLHELEKRVQVLERIVTDGKADLRRQFIDLGE
jgi:hypothetical protein